MFPRLVVAPFQAFGGVFATTPPPVGPLLLVPPAPLPLVVAPAAIPAVEGKGAHHQGSHKAIELVLQAAHRAPWRLLLHALELPGEHVPPVDHQVLAQGQTQ